MLKVGDRVRVRERKAHMFYTHHVMPGETGVVLCRGRHFGIHFDRPELNPRQTGDPVIDMWTLSANIAHLLRSVELVEPHFTLSEWVSQYEE